MSICICLIEVSVIIRGCRGFIVRVHAKAAPLAKTAPWSAPAKTLWTAPQSTERASAKRVGTLTRGRMQTGAKLVKQL